MLLPSLNELELYSHSNFLCYFSFTFSILFCYLSQLIISLFESVFFNLKACFIVHCALFGRALPFTIVSTGHKGSRDVLWSNILVQIGKRINQKQLL